MNRRYIDFVPPKTDAGARPVRATAPRPTRAAARPARVATARPVNATAVRTVSAAAPRRPQTRPATSQSQNSLAARRATQIGFSSASSQKSQLGVIEDLTPKFINTNTEKRPLNSGRTATTSRATATPRSTGKTAGRTKATGSKVAQSASKKTTASAGKAKTPKSPFINLDKIAKRPLSRNVREKKIESPKEVPKGPVTIIAKPEKESHVGLIITIILTIILGAAAGTIAFLLLPK